VGCFVWIRILDLRCDCDYFLMPDSVTIFECDHLRPVAFVTDSHGRWEWRHIIHDGTLSTTCKAGVYKVKASTEKHTLDKLCQKF
jgi:hypothetical protein